MFQPSSIAEMLCELGACDKNTLPIEQPTNDLGVEYDSDKVAVAEQVDDRIRGEAKAIADAGQRAKSL